MSYQNVAKVWFVNCWFVKNRLDRRFDTDSWLRMVREVREETVEQVSEQ